MTSDHLSREAVVEAVARRIYDRRNGHGCRSWSRLPHSHQAPYRDDAEASLEAQCEIGGGREALEAGARSLDWFRSCGEPGSVADRKYSKIAALLRAIGGGE